MKRGGRPHRGYRRTSWGPLLGLLTVGVLACQGAFTDPAGVGQSARLRIFADLSGTSVDLLVVEVTAAELEAALVFNLPLEPDGTASGTLELPAGSDRTIRLQAFNPDGVETHRGQATVDIAPGSNPTLSITLIPLTGDLPIDVRLGSILVTVSPSTATLRVGETLRLTATVRDAEGNELDEEVAWATLDPDVATVDPAGLVTATGVGQAQIVSSFAGIAGSAEVTVLADQGAAHGTRGR